MIGLGLRGVKEKGIIDFFFLGGDLNDARGVRGVRGDS